MCTERVQQLFASSTLRVYTSDDVVGVEVGGALKNIFAIAGECSQSLRLSLYLTISLTHYISCFLPYTAGMAEGMGLGINTMAALVTRGCSEMTRLAVRMGAKPETLSGLSGIGAHTTHTQN